MKTDMPIFEAIALIVEALVLGMAGGLAAVLAVSADTGHPANILIRWLFVGGVTALTVRAIIVVIWYDLINRFLSILRRKVQNKKES